MLASQLLMLAADTRTNCGHSSLPGLYDKLCVNGQVSIEGLPDVMILISNVIRMLMTAAGGLAVIFIVIGGIYYVTAAGEPSRISRAKDIITQAVIGLVVVGVAYSAVTFISGKF